MNNFRSEKINLHNAVKPVILCIWEQNVEKFFITKTDMKTM